MTLAELSLLVTTTVALPPERYRYEPTAVYHIERVQPENMIDACLPAKPVPVGKIKVGCSTLRPIHHAGFFGYIIYIDARLTGKAYKRVLMHEKGHVNGWRHE